MGRGRAGLNSPSILGEDSSPFPFANVDDDILAEVSNSPNGRGRRSAAVSSTGVQPRSSPLASQAGAQNSLSVNENAAPTTNLHGSSASQTTSLTPWDPAATPHPNTPSPNVRSRRTHLSGPACSRSHQRARRDAALGVFEPRLAETTPLLATLLAWTTLPTLPSSDSAVFEPRPADSTRIAPLFATLFPGLGNLTVDP